MSFGGCCLIEEGAYKPVTTIIPAEDLPNRFQRPGRAPASLVRQFIARAVDLLEMESVSGREIVKDALGMELHPLLFPALLSYLDA